MSATSRRGHGDDGDGGSGGWRHYIAPADSIADALSDELEDVYGRLARAEAALATVEQPAEARTTDQARFSREAAGAFEGDGHSTTRYFGHQVVAELRRMVEEARS
ncbi:hypothetical protein R1T08_02250 [Streptomyces sp. SBC-4]|nr:hypothetical protein [Streptomyces sp. SBC-4]MDV5143162.1 hypothetical protein [Streptomyces sp. SBC-4]